MARIDHDLPVDPDEPARQPTRGDVADRRAHQPGAAPTSVLGAIHSRPSVRQGNI
jgi:hypothetical protein